MRCVSRVIQLYTRIEETTGGDRPKTSERKNGIPKAGQYDTESGGKNLNDYRKHTTNREEVENDDQSEIVFGQSGGGGDCPKTQKSNLKVADSTIYASVENNIVVSEKDFFAHSGIKVENDGQSEIVFGHSGGVLSELDSILKNNGFIGFLREEDRQILNSFASDFTANKNDLRDFASRYCVCGVKGCLLIKFHV